MKNLLVLALASLVLAASVSAKEFVWPETELLRPTKTEIRIVRLIAEQKRVPAPLQRQLKVSPEMAAKIRQEAIKVRRLMPNQLIAVVHDCQDGVEKIVIGPARGELDTPYRLLPAILIARDSHGRRYVVDVRPVGLDPSAPKNEEATPRG